MKRTDVLDVILDGPRVQVPVECLDRSIGRTRPIPPPPPQRLETSLELEDGSEISLEDDLPREAFCCEESEPCPQPDAVTWACPSHWLQPSMRGEGGTIWLDPEPLRLVGPVVAWLSPRSENGRN